MRSQFNTFSTWTTFKDEICNSDINKLKEMINLLLKEIFEMTSSHQTTLSHQDHQELAYHWNKIAMILDERDLRFLRNVADSYFEAQFNQAPLEAHQAWKLAREDYQKSPSSNANVDYINHTIYAEESATRRLEAVSSKITQEERRQQPYARYRWNPYSVNTNAVLFSNRSDERNESNGVAGIVTFSSRSVVER